jgi:NAD(P)H-dependent flavin oxidoreductase YrpB (nitropropane dioxygenase family)
METRRGLALDGTSEGSVAPRARTTTRAPALDIVRTCRDAGVPFAGIVSSGRLAALYERWGAEFLVAGRADAGGHIGDVDHPLPAILADVRASSGLVQRTR